MTARTYLDFNASHPLRSEARSAMISAMEINGNPSSVHRDGWAARALVEAARRDVAALVDADPGDVIFTSGATEANCSVVAGGWGAVFLSRLEHDSVTKPVTKSGATVHWITATPEGTINLAALEQVVNTAGHAGPERRLVCITAANNETGVLQPVADAVSIARRGNSSVFSDAVQLAGRAKFSAALEVDYLSVSAHKIGGPKGVGALVVRHGQDLQALVQGGGQERGRRAGTENVIGIAGFGAAARAALRDIDTFRRVETLREALWRGVQAVSPDAVLLGDKAVRLANTLCVATPGYLSEAIVIQLDLAGIAVSAGAACSSGKVGSSATLSAMGVDPDLARSAIRFSLGTSTSEADIAAAVAAWREIMSRRSAAA